MATAAAAPIARRIDSWTRRTIIFSFLPSHPGLRIRKTIWTLRWSFCFRVVVGVKPIPPFERPARPSAADRSHNFYFHSPRNASTACCKLSGVTPSGATGSPTARPIFENGAIRVGRDIAGPSLRLKKLPHSPRSAIGTTLTGVRPMIHDAGAKRIKLPLSVMRPSGKCRPDRHCATRWRFHRRLSPAVADYPPMQLNRLAGAEHEVERPAPGICCGPLRSWIGLRHAPPMINASTKLTWLHTNTTGPFSGIFRAAFFATVNEWISSHTMNRIRNSGTSV